MSTELDEFIAWLAAESRKADEGWMRATESMQVGAGTPKFLAAMQEFESQRDRHELIRQAKQLVNEWRASR